MYSDHWLYRDEVRRQTALIRQQQAELLAVFMDCCTMPLKQGNKEGPQCLSATVTLNTVVQYSAPTKALRTLTTTL